MRQDVAFVLESADWPALLIEKPGTIRRCNSSAVEQFGQGIMGSSSSLMQIWSGENGMTPEEFVHRGETASADFPNFLRLRLRSGRTQQFRSHVNPVHRDGHQYLVLQLFVSDETSNSNRAAALPAAISEAYDAPVEAEAEQRLENATIMDSSAAHKQKLDCALQLARSVALDFNNALTSILGHTSLLLGKMEITHPWRSSLVEVEKSASRAAEIANDLGSFSRQEKDAKVQTSGNLNTLLQRVTDLFPSSDAQPLKWHLELERKLFSSNFDEAKIQQALVKVIENAVQSMPHGGTITVHSKNLEVLEPIQDRNVKLNPGNYIAAEISDSGVGVPAEALPRLFEPFFTTKGSAHRGLGLAYVYGIITNHGGGVAVSSEINAGTSVRIYLPANKKIIKQTFKEDELTGNETILIVDDEDLLLTMGQMILSSFGYNVLTANSGQKALELLKKEFKPVDLIITDLVMPNMSGRELIEKLQEISPTTRVICSSGYVRSGNGEDSDTYLQKPFTSQDLLRKVKQVLHPEV
ncbi:MAG: putative Histidine kinase [Verrucomicrobiales bacterium]|nr:putative Histidine kinase [Verrucomicrobiales bacterium]